MPVTTTLDIVDKVNLEDDERLDIPDTQSIAELVSETVVRMLGGLFGGARKGGDSADLTVSGSLNNIVFNTTVLSATTIPNKCMLLNFRQNETGDDEGQVVWYDPADPGQQTTIDISPYQAGSLTPYIWAKRYDIADDADTRKKWVSGAETTFSLATRQRHRVEWAVDAGDHRTATGDDQWFVVAQIESWSVPVTGIPLIRTWHPFDAGSPISSGLQDSWTLGRVAGAYDISSLGINHAMRLILHTLMRYRKVDGTVHPLLSGPAQGLDDLGLVVAGLQEHNDDLAVSAIGIVRLAASGSGGWNVINSLNYSGVVTASNGWKLTVTFVAPVNAIKSVQVTTGGAVGAVNDIYAQVVDITGGAVTLDVNTMVNLAANSYDWTNIPGGSPTANLTLDIMAVQ
jgi:hypothetical protein